MVADLRGEKKSYDPPPASRAVVIELRESTLI
jgi:hypothetical protein